MRAPWLSLAIVMATLVAAYLAFALLPELTVLGAPLRLRDCYLVVAGSALLIAVGLPGTS
jgi:hypothetical protein